MASSRLSASQAHSVARVVIVVAALPTRSAARCEVVPGPPISRSIARLVRATAVFCFAVHLRLLLRSAGREGYPLPNIISRSPWGDAPLVDHLEFSQIYTQRSARDRLLSTSTHTRLRIRGRSADRIAKADVEGGGRGRGSRAEGKSVCSVHDMFHPPPEPSEMRMISTFFRGEIAVRSRRLLHTRLTELRSFRDDQG